MHWRFKTVDPTLIRHFSFSFGPLAALQTLLVRFAVALSAIGPSTAPALRELSYCTVWGGYVLKDSLFVSAIPPLFNLALVCDRPYLSRSHESDSSSNVVWLMLSADCVLFTRTEQCSCRVLPCPSISWGFFCCQWLRVLSTLFLCHRLAGSLLMLVTASRCGIIHC